MEYPAPLAVSRVTAITLDDIDDAVIGLALDDVMVPTFADGSSESHVIDEGELAAALHREAIATARSRTVSDVERDAIDRVLVSYLLDLDRKA